MTSGRLAGRRVLVTRPADTAGELVRSLERDGASVTHLPVIEIRPRPAADIARQVSSLVAPDLVIFVSRNSVEFGARELRPLRAPVAAIGPATRAALEASGTVVDVCAPAGYDSEHLLALDALSDMAGRKVLIVRGQDGRALLGNTLAERGASVEYLAVYDRLRSNPPGELLDAVRRQLADSAFDFVVVMSVESFDNLVSLLDDDDLQLLANATLVTPAARVIITARGKRASIRCVLAKDPRAPGIVDAIRGNRQADFDTSDGRQ